MSGRALLVLSTILLCGGASLAHAADLYVICNSNVSLAIADIRDVFLGDKQFAGSVKLMPVDNSAAQALFLEKVMKMNAARYSTAWTKKSFRDGISPPPVEGSDAETLVYVRHTPGACSYLTTPETNGVVIVSKF
jgi:hypothetical protein